MHDVDPVLLAYLRGPGPHRLEIGSGHNGKKGWLSSDLHRFPHEEPAIVLDAAATFPIPSDCFDCVYSEHMIEHLPYEAGRNMIEECHRILKPGGAIRVVTPSLGFLLRVISPDRSALEERYREWSVRQFVANAPAVTNALFINNFMRNWRHTFIYDRETLDLALRRSGFERVTEQELNRSDHALLRDLENEKRLPPGFLALESMVMEAVKGAAPSARAPRGRNLALGKTATQSSVSEWSREATPELDATRVVSGNFTGSYNCHTEREMRPWWRVDLEQRCRIEQVRIYNRVTTWYVAQRTSRFELQVCDDDRTWRTVFRKDSDTLVHGTPLSHFIWTPEAPVEARYVRLQLPGQEFLHLEQVEIYGEG